MPAESLVPGYKLVETFGPVSEYETRPSADSGGNEDEEEVEEEVEYVTLEISGIADVDPNLLTSYRLIGVDTPTPFLQLSSSGTIFKGRHQQLLGTELLFSHAQGDSDPSARHMPLLGTTEQRIVFSPVEVRNPASSSSTSGSTSNVKTPGKESSSKKGKKKANVGANGIEEVAGSLNSTAEPALFTRSRMSGKKKDMMGQGNDNDEDMYATEDGSDADVGGGDEELEGNTSGEEHVAAGAKTDLPPRKKRKPTRGKGKTTEILQAPPTPTMLADPNAAQGQHPQGLSVTSSGTSIAIDPVLEAFQVPSNQPSPKGPGSGVGI